MSASLSVFVALCAVVGLILVPLIGVGGIGLNSLFGKVIPLVALILFVVGFIYRIVEWARIPVPFRIPTTGGQAKTLPMFKQDRADCPFTTWEVIIRMFLEVFLFRSLFRNTKTEVREGPRQTVASAKWLWMAGILFHYSFLTIVVRHVRFFAEPVPLLVQMITTLDGFFDIFLPALFLTDIAFLVAAGYLFLRRVVIPQLRYISLPTDYFPLFLILGIGLSGVLMREVYKVDLLKVKQLTMSLAGFSFSTPVPEGIGLIFYVHLFLVCVLIGYFPWSKLMHAGGVFMSPTRNLANNNRAVRHINPWNYPVKVHTYEEYEDEFRAKMKEVGLPVDKE